MNNYNIAKINADEQEIDSLDILDEKYKKIIKPGLLSKTTKKTGDIIPQSVKNITKEHEINLSEKELFIQIMKLVEEGFNKVEEIGQDVKNHKIIIGHTDAIELAYELEGLLKEKLGNDLDIDFVIVNPTCGSHCGPDAVGISFYSKCR